jgi:hypothetical protein
MSKPPKAEEEESTLGGLARVLTEMPNPDVAPAAPAEPIAETTSEPSTSGPPEGTGDITH